MTKKEIINKVIEDLPTSDLLSELSNDEWDGWFEEVFDKAQKLGRKLPIHSVNNWVAVKDALPNDDNQVFVKYENGRYGINEWRENDNCWKYQFDNMIVKEWMKPPCC